MKYKLDEKIKIEIFRRESSFDRACEEARDQALDILGAHPYFSEFKNVENSNGICESMILEFIKYRHTTDGFGDSHFYIFEAWVEKSKDFNDE